MADFHKGGWQPLWSSDGRELFYMVQAGVMGVSVETTSGFVPGASTLVIEGQYFARVGRTYDIAPDGQRFLMIREGDATTDDTDEPFAGLTQIVVVQNWTTELERLVPTP